MRVAFSLAALVASALAQTASFNPIYTPGRDQVVSAGSDFSITWTAPTHNGPEDKVNIELLAGLDQNSMTQISTIATGIVNNVGKYSWKVDSGLGKDPKHAYYGIRMRLVSNPDIFQYSPRFKIANDAANAIDSGAAPSNSQVAKPSYAQGGETGATSSLPAVYAPTTAVPVKPAATSSLYAPAASVICADKNSTGVLAKPAGPKAIPSSSNSTLLNANGNKSNNSGFPVQATNGAALLHTSLFGLCGGLLAFMFVL
ncbi:hypothetical protein CP532_3550 [Ophiocordyceps camponoti-leonardi (nom. inval.)]|nr:hypothetical protein CP532_3550 [Ophiocordyceps camponoti-leonardi (nom. inval.)]